MKSIENLNAIIEKELNSDVHDGLKINNLLKVARRLYYTLSYMSSFEEGVYQYVIYPGDVIRLGENIVKLENILGVSYDDSVKTI